MESSSEELLLCYIILYKQYFHTTFAFPLCNELFCSGAFDYVHVHICALRCVQVLLFLNNAIGKKGPIEKMSDYWDVATFFEIKLLMEDYAHCVQAAECMYRLNPPAWYLNSTLSNISIIENARQKRAAELAAAAASAAHSQQATGFGSSSYGSSQGAGTGAAPSTNSNSANSVPSADRQVKEHAKQVLAPRGCCLRVAQ